MLKMVDGTGIIGVDMVCPLGGTVSPPQPPNYDKVEVEGVGSLTLPNSLKAPLERVELLGNSVQGENPAPDNPQEIKSAGREVEGKYLLDLKITGKNLLNVSSEAISGKNADGKYNIQDGVITFNTINNWGGDYIYFNSIDTRNNKNLTFSGNATLSENPSDIGRGCRILVIAYDKNGALLTDVDTIFAEESYQWIYNKYYKGFISNNRINEGLSAKLTDEVDKITVGVCYSNTAADYPVRISDVQVEYGTVNTEYEPYTEQTMQIALDEPLKGIKRPFNGEFIQETLSQSGIIRRFKEIEITKNARILTHLGNYGAPEINSILARYPDASLKKRGAVLCEELKIGNAWGSEEESIYMTEQGIDFRLSRERLRLGSDTTPEENQAAVIKYLTDHPLHCVAELNVPTTEPFPESVQAQLSSLHSENGTTHVFVDSGEVPCGIKLTYRKEI